jgi:hypothetical protein
MKKINLKQVFISAVHFLRRGANDFRVVPASAQFTDADKFEVFEKWLLDNGSKFPKLELKVGMFEMSGRGFT